MMRWRSTPSEQQQKQEESPASNGGGHDNDLPAMSSSMDDDEPDSSSSDPVHSDGASKDQQQQPRHGHGRLGSFGSDLPPSAGGLLETDTSDSHHHHDVTSSSNLTDTGGSNPRPHEAEANSKSQSIGSQSQSQSSQAISPATAKAGPDMDNNHDDDDDDYEEEDDDDDDGLDHSQPPDDLSETDTQTTPWKPQMTQSTCEFTHTIVNYSQKRESGCKKAEYSATTVDEFGNRWRLIVYVNGNGRASNHHLSLFLQVSSYHIVSSDSAVPHVLQATSRPC